MSTPRITLVWPDGTITTGETYREVEDAVRAAQWVTYPTRHAFRQDMRRRAAVWSGFNAPRLSYTPKDFINTLAAAGMFLVATEQGEEI